MYSHGTHTSDRKERMSLKPLVTSGILVMWMPLWAHLLFTLRSGDVGILSISCKAAEYLSPVEMRWTRLRILQ
jgi:hypothetical protein